MLVMAVMAVVAGLVLPNMFQPSRASLDDSGRHMIRLMKLAAEEAQLSGAAVRLTAWKDRFVFEQVGEEGGWRAMGGAPFDAAALPQGVHIAELKLSRSVGFYGGVAAQDAQTGDAPDDKQQGRGKIASLGSVVMMPDGMLTPADLTMASPEGELHIEIRPGPGGIRIVEPGP